MRPKLAMHRRSQSGGPILGQNYGALRFDRLRSTMRNAFLIIIIYTIMTWLLLALGRNLIAGLFGVEGQARDLVVFFCLFVSLSFLFNGLLFVANAAFNNLGYPVLSTVFNWGRSTLGVIPFCWIGSKLYGAESVLGGYGLGAVFFGTAAAIVCLRVIDRIAAQPATNSPFTSGKGAT